jgi:archaeal flagellin FlaB
MKALSGSEEAFTGLEAAIVLIAFVVVAAVFSYVVLGAGFFTTQKSQEVVHSGVEAASANIEILGDVYGFNGTPFGDVSGGGKMTRVNFTIGLSAGGTPIDMQRMTIVYSNATGRYELGMTSPWFSTVANGNWTVVKMDGGDVNALLEKGEQADIAVRVFGARPALPRDWITIEIQPIEGATLTIRKTIPAALEPVQKLW